MAADGKRGRTIGLLALAAPGVVALADGLLARSGGARVAASTTIGTILAAGYLALAFGVGPVRRFLADLGAFVAARVHDPDLGWRLRPDFSVVRPTESYTSRETINSLGFRTPDRPFAKPAGVKRIVVLGDSHTEAYTVNDDETWPVRLEKALGGPERVEVVSLGVGGYSTDQELLCYAHYGRRFAPDLVLLQTAANDVDSNVMDRYWRGLKPRFVRHGETLLLTGVPVPDMRGIGLAGHPLLRHSAIALVLDSSLARFAVEGAREKADRAEGWEVTRCLVRDLANMVEADGAEFLMFDATPDEDAAAEFGRIAREHGLRHVDLTPAFGGDLTGCRVPGDQHWNAKGHAAVAAYLAPLLRPLLD